MTDRVLLERALKALEEISGGYSQNLIAALRDRLAQPLRTHWEGCDEVHPECRKPRREWVGLTRDEVLDIEETAKHPLDFARAIETKLKEKNT